MRYEIAITGSSRPALYPIFWESLKMLKMKERPKITAYEDVIFPDESKKVKEFIADKVDEYHEFNPNLRLGMVFQNLLNNLHKEYFIYLQEDWKILKEIDVDLCVEILDKNPDIQQIWFPKKLENYTYNKFCDETIQIDDVNFVPYTSWTMIPNISRTKFVRNLWENGELKKHPRPESPMKKYMKGAGLLGKDKRISYILGEKYDEYIEHLGLPSDDGLQFDMRSTKMIERKQKGHSK